jgi:hypothetical protein
MGQPNAQRVAVDRRGGPFVVVGKDTLMLISDARDTPMSGLSRAEALPLHRKLPADQHKITILRRISRDQPLDTLFKAFQFLPTEQLLELGLRLESAKTSGTAENTPSKIIRWPLEGSRLLLVQLLTRSAADTLKS